MREGKLRAGTGFVKPQTGSKKPTGAPPPGRPPGEADRILREARQLAREDLDDT